MAARSVHFANVQSVSLRHVVPIAENVTVLLYSNESLRVDASQKAHHGGYQAFARGSCAANLHPSRSLRWAQELVLHPRAALRSRHPDGTSHIWFSDLCYNEGYLVLVRCGAGDAEATQGDSDQSCYD